MQVRLVFLVRLFLEVICDILSYRIYRSLKIMKVKFVNDTIGAHLFIYL